ncbi:MAG: hypothetical protein AAGA56_03895 [Myxococcota bacterium]
MIGNAVRVLGLAAVLCTAAGCEAPEPTTETSSFTSAEDTLLEFSFSSELWAPVQLEVADHREHVMAQLLYLSGELDHQRDAHGQFGDVVFDELRVEPLEGRADLERVVYTVRLPVAWSRGGPIPETYPLVMPRVIEEEALGAFNERYAGVCGPAQYGAETLWYDYQPVATECATEQSDIVRSVAEVAPYTEAMTLRRPEYEKFWADDEFRVVIVHGTEHASSVDSSDPGVAEYLKLRRSLEVRYPDAEWTEESTPSGIYDHWRLEADIPAYEGGAGKLVVDAILADALARMGGDFDSRFATLSAPADFVAYAGHSAGSRKVVALADKMTVTPEHYQVVFLDGFSTLAYLDRTLTNRRREVNGLAEDPNGTEYLDLILNAQPVPWWSGADSLERLIVALSADEAQSYLDIVDGLSASGVTVVAGADDNPRFVE